jgi:DNA primase
MSEGLFSDDLYRRAYLAVASVTGNIAGALEAADPDAREVIERAAVADIDSDPFTEAKNLISAAVRRELSIRNRITDPDEIRADRDARILLEEIDNPTMADAVAMELLDWLGKRVGEHA